MKNFFLCIFVLCALPFGLSISCYQCVPDATVCTSNVTNITDCDTLGAPNGTYDACMITSRIVAMGDQDVTMNAMSCAIKYLCDNGTKEACEPIQGFNTKKCDSSCCFKDKCNGLEAAITPTNGPGSNTFSNVASFIYILMCDTVIFAKVFLH